MTGMFTRIVTLGVGSIVMATQSWAGSGYSWETTTASLGASFISNVGPWGLVVGIVSMVITYVAMPERDNLLYKIFLGVVACAIVGGAVSFVTLSGAPAAGATIR